MKAPHHELAEMIACAIERAVDELQAPLSRIEVDVGSNKVRCWSGRRSLTLVAARAEAGHVDRNGRFSPVPGGGGWSLSVVERGSEGLLALLTRSWRKRH